MSAINYKKEGKLYLLEMLPDAAVEFDGDVVALTAEAIYGLLSRKIPFTTPDDYFSQDLFCSYSKLYANTLGDWIDLLDKTLLERFKLLKELNIRPAHLYGYYLQLLIEPFILATLEIKAIIENLKPKEIVFFCYKQSEKKVDYKLFVKGCSIEFLLLPYLCQKDKITYTVKSFLKKGKALSINNFVRKPLGIIKNNLKNCLLSFQPYDLYKNKASILMLTEAWGIKKIGVSASGKGYRLISKVPQYFFKKNLRHPDLDIYSLGINNKVFNSIATEDISILYSHRLDFFIKTICPNLEQAVKYYLDIFKKEKIKFVLTPYKSKFEDFAVMAAANSAKDTLAVQIDHGYSNFDINSWKFTEQPCNLYLTVADEPRQYYVDNLFKKTNTEIKIGQSWTKKFRDLGKNRICRSNKKSVLYIPTHMVGSLKRIDDARYLDAWYFKHQLRLLEYFHTEEKFDFIYKAHRGEEVFNPVPKIIKEAGWKNIVYSDRDLYSHFKEADFAVLDFASTPFFEAALARIPTICFYYEGFRIRDSAREFFGKMLQPFSTTDEAIEKIHNFLIDRPDGYIKSIPQAEEDTFKIIEENADKILKSKSVHKP